MSTWTAFGGIKENPGVYDNGNGAIVYVASRQDGVIRRVTAPYAAGRGAKSTIYTCDPRDRGGAFVPFGVERHKTAAAAAAAARQRRADE